MEIDYRKIPSVLLVDDDDATNFLHKMVIESTELADNIVVLEDGKEALEFLIDGLSGEESLPNIILLDINMPYMNGWDFLKAYSELDFPGKEDIYICMLTTSLNPNDKERAEKIPDIKNYKTKLLDKETFTEIVEKYFKKS